MHIIEIEFVPADGLYHSKYAGYSFIENYIKCHLEKPVEVSNKDNYLSMFFSNGIEKTHTNIIDTINYLPIKPQKTVEKNGAHFFYSGNNKKLSAFINSNYPMISFQRYNNAN